jgi:hypothetical protein
MRSPAGEEGGPFGFDHCRPESQQATDMSPEEEVVYDFVTDLTTKHAVSEGCSTARKSFSANSKSSI